MLKLVRSSALALFACVFVFGDAHAQPGVGKRWEDMTPAEKQFVADQNAKMARYRKCTQVRIIATSAMAYRNGRASYEYAYSSILSSSSGPAEAIRQISTDGESAAEKTIWGAYNWKSKEYYPTFAYKRCMAVEPFELF